MTWRDKETILEDLKQTPLRMHNFLTLGQPAWPIDIYA